MKCIGPATKKLVNEHKFSLMILYTQNEWWQEVQIEMKKKKVGWV